VGGSLFVKGCLPPLCYVISVAAAADEKKGDDKEPDPVVIKKSAKAVCHDKFLREIGK